MHMWANLDTWVSNKGKKNFLIPSFATFCSWCSESPENCWFFQPTNGWCPSHGSSCFSCQVHWKRYVAVCLFTANMSRYRLPDIMYQSNFNFLLFCFVLTSEREWPFLHCEVQKSPLSTWHWEFSMLVYGTFCQWKHKRIVKHVLLWLTYFPSSRITEQELQFPFMALLISGVDLTNLMFS